MLKAKPFALSLGFVYGGAFLLLGLFSMFGWGVKVVEVFSSMYVGYGPSLVGSLVGGLWGFVDGAIGGYVFAVLYNHFSK